MSNNNWKLAYSLDIARFNDENLQKLAQLGITEIELSEAFFQPFFELGFVSDPVKIVEQAKKFGVNISSVHLPFGPYKMMDPSTDNDEYRYASLTIQKALIDSASKAGIGIAVVHPSSEPYPDCEREERMQRACKFLKELCNYAKERGVTLALENLPRTCLGRVSDEMTWFLQQIPDMVACFDTNHSLTEDNAHFIRALGDKIVTIHVSDYDFVNERHTLPGEGKNDWDAILQALTDVGYKGRFLYEVKAVYPFEQVADNYHTFFGKKLQ